MGAQHNKEKKELLKMLSQKFASEKQVLKLEMEAKCQQDVLDAEAAMRGRQNTAIAELTQNLQKMNDDKVSDLEKSFSESCTNEKA